MQIDDYLYRKDNSIMLSKNKIKLIKSLDDKKIRQQESLFLAEGSKTVSDCLSSFSCELLLATPEWLSLHPGVKAREIIEASHEEISRASLLKSPQDVLAVFRQTTTSIPDEKTLKDKLSLALDKVQDPGNLGTIIRIADWFGITDLFCSPDTADLYNPKVVQATMGALSRVAVHYLPLKSFLESLKETPIFGTFLDGETIYSTPCSSNGIILMGNEGNGISSELEQVVTHRLFIPSYPPERPTSESLNVAIATAILCAEFRRP